MWRVLAAFVVLGSVVASAQTMTIPDRYTKAAGGDAYKALAGKGDTIEVQVYRDRDFGELDTISWEWKAGTATRRELEQFEHELARRTLTDRAHVVSSSAQFDRDPMEVSILEADGVNQKYHRRLYAVDANNVVHVWWTVCSAVSTLLLPCGQAQRTMKLEIPNSVALPTRGPTVPPPPPMLSEPWHIVLPPGYVESDQANTSVRTTVMRTITGFEASQVRVFVSGPVRLLVIALRSPAGDDAPSETIANLDAHVSDGLSASLEQRDPTTEHLRPQLPTWGDNIVSRESFNAYERRTLYAATEPNEIYAFTAVCIGQRFEREECEKALESMRLVVPDQISGDSLQRRRHQLRDTVLAVVAGVVTIALIVWMRRRRPDSAS